MSAREEHPVLHGRRVVLRLMTAEELRPMAAKLATDPESSPWWGTDEDTIAGWLSDPQSVVYVIEVGDTAAGIVTFDEETDPDYRSVGVDISLLSGFVGRGLGPEALRTLLRYLFDGRGHHRATIDPAVANGRAIRAYLKVGFRPVGVMRRYERTPDGSWRDGLLMDLLAEEFDPGA